MGESGSTSKISPVIWVAIIGGAFGLLGTIITVLANRSPPQQIVISATPLKSTETPTPTPTSTLIPTDTPSPTPPLEKVDDFVGQWINQNPGTSGITRVEIDRRLNDLTIHIWGACTPTDCDWGTEITDVSDSDDGILSITWDQGFAELAQQITILPDGRLQVVGNRHFTDNSGRPDLDSTSYLKRD